MVAEDEERNKNSAKNELQTEVEIDVEETVGGETLILEDRV